MCEDVIIMGAGGHAKVIADIIHKSGDNVLGFLDDTKEKGNIIIKDINLKVIGKVDECVKISKINSNVKFIIAIGNNQIRKQISERYKDIEYYTAIHPSAQIALDVEIEEGTAIMANACINTSAKIGKHCIINTGAIVEHDNQIENYVHISPNGTCCGTVKIGELTHIGAGAIVKNNINITSECVIGAGTIVVKDINEKGTYIGVPAKKMKEKLKDVDYER